MHGDDVPVVGPDPPPAPSGPPRLPGWVTASTVVAAVVVIVLVSGGGEVPQPAVTTFPVLPTIASTTTAPGPDPPAGVIVEQTLRWEQATGLTDFMRLAGVVRHDGQWIAVGQDEGSVLVWRSESGRSWELLSSSELGPGRSSFVGNVVVSGDHLVVPVSGPDGGEMWSSSDGAEWSRHPLPVEGEWLGYAYELYATANGLVAMGWVDEDTRWLTEHIPTELAEFVESGDAWAYRSGVNEVTVSVAYLSDLYVGELVDPPVASPPPGDGTARWAGPDAASLEWVDPIPVHRVRQLANGQFIGHVESSPGRLMASDDGLNWVTLPTSPIGYLFEAWEEGLVAVGTLGHQVVGLDPWSGSRQPLLEGDPLARVDHLAAGGAGIVTVTADDVVPEVEATVEVWSEGGVTVDLRREVVRITTSDRTWSMSWWGLVTTLDGDRLHLQIDDSPEVSVPLETWVEATTTYSSATFRLPPTIIHHSPDGLHWSETGWDDLVASPAGSWVEVFVTDDFVLAFEQGIHDNKTGTAMVGFPLPGTDD